MSTIDIYGDFAEEHCLVYANAEVLYRAELYFFIIIFIILLFSICTQWSHKDVILSLLLTGSKVHWIVLFAPMGCHYLEY